MNNHVSILRPGLKNIGYSGWDDMLVKKDTKLTEVTGKKRYVKKGDILLSPFEFLIIN